VRGERRERQKREKREPGEKEREERKDKENEIVQEKGVDGREERALTLCVQALPLLRFWRARPVT
jgi:hypothetical protein